MGGLPEQIPTNVLAPIGTRLWQLDPGGPQLGTYRTLE